MEAKAITHANQVFALDRRMHDRIEVAIWTRMKVENQPEYPARVSNLSRSGFMAMTSCPLHDYALVMIELPRIGWVRATALWSMVDRVGCEFEQALSPDAFEHLRQLRIMDTNSGQSGPDNNGRFAKS